jgi:predicted TIM-barrel fold metal-dependent hydrolase
MIIDFRMVAPFELYLERAEVDDAVNGGVLGRYDDVYSGVNTPFELNLELMLESMEDGRVDKAVLQAEWLFGDYRRLNDTVAQLVDQYPDRYAAGYLTVNPAENDDMVAVVEEGIRDRGFRGVNVQPFAYELRCDDRVFYPLYEKCLELDVPVTIHTAINFASNRTIDYGRPLHLDKVACDFPGLKLVASHGGWPWVNELVAVAWKHPSVYIEIGAISPKYIGMPGTGWEPLLVYGNSLLQDRVLWATDAMVPHKRSIEELRALPLKESVKEKWLGLNAARLLGIEVPAAAGTSSS